MVAASINDREEVEKPVVELGFVGRRRVGLLKTAFHVIFDWPGLFGDLLLERGQATLEVAAPLLDRQQVAGLSVEEEQ